MIKTMQHKAFLKYLNMKLHTIYCELSKHYFETWKSNQRPHDNAVTKMELNCRHKDGTHGRHIAGTNLLSQRRNSTPSQERNSYAVTKMELICRHKDETHMPSQGQVLRYQYHTEYSI